MDTDNLFGKYKLSEITLQKLENIRNILKDDILNADPTWEILMGKDAETPDTDDEENDEDIEEVENMAKNMNNSVQIMSTQFYFTQTEKNYENDSAVDSLKPCDILETIYERLECNSGKLDTIYLDNLSNENLLEVVNNLGARLTPKGVYNLCCSLIDTDIEQKIRYINIFCTHLLVPQIIAIEEPSRLITSAITEIVEKCPDDALKFIVLPILNADLKNTTIINIVVKSYDDNRKFILLSEFAANTKELKPWHIPVLQNLIPTKTDQATNDRLIKLFSEKAFTLSKDKPFGKLLLSFVKMNRSFSEEQKQSLHEIIIVNETTFKRSLENVLKNM